jgi:hypothetical protein
LQVEFAANGGTIKTITSYEASVLVEGAEFDATWNATKSFRPRFTLSYLPVAKYVSYPDAAITAPNPNPAVGRAINATTDLSGQRLQKAQKVQASLLLNYDKQLGIGALAASANIGYSSAFHYDVGGFIIQQAYALVNLNASWSPNSSPFQFGLFVKNATNKVVVQSYV